MGDAAPIATAMEVESTERRRDVTTTSGTGPRKRNCPPSQAGSEDTVLYSCSSDDASDDEGFERVVHRKAKRRNISERSSSSKSTVLPQRRPSAHTLLFMPDRPVDNLNRLNRQAVSVTLEALVPGEIKDIRINNRKNVLAIDVRNRSAINALMAVKLLGNINVHYLVPQDYETTAGVVYDIDTSISDSDLPILIKPATDGIALLQARRLGNSSCVKLDFKGDCLPSHVKVGHFRHVVRPFVPKPLQCRRCQRLGHVSAVCRNSTVCPRCSEQHDADTCRATELKCTNCQGSHAASSKDCPRLKKEQKILRKMARDGSSHRDASAAIRRHRSRKGKSTKSSSGSREMTRPAVPPPAPSVSNKSTNVSEKSNHGVDTSSSEEWPALPKTCQTPEPQHMTRHLQSNVAAVDHIRDKDLQVIAMLKSLTNVMRLLLTNMDTPAARSALQVLDTLTPVLESFV